MWRGKRRALAVVSWVIALAVVLGIGYAYQRSNFVRKTNALFDPQNKAFSGVFLPWPFGHPTLAGHFDPQTDRRIRAAIGYEFSGSMTTNGMTLTIHDSDGTYFVHAN